MESRALAGAGELAGRPHGHGGPRVLPARSPSATSRAAECGGSGGRVPPLPAERRRGDRRRRRGDALQPWYRGLRPHRGVRRGRPRGAAASDRAGAGLHRRAAARFGGVGLPARGRRGRHRDLRLAAERFGSGRALRPGRPARDHLARRQVSDAHGGAGPPAGGSRGVPAGGGHPYRHAGLRLVLVLRGRSRTRSDASGSTEGSRCVGADALRRG